MIGSATIRPAVQADVSSFEHWLSADAENSWQVKDFVRAIETDNDSLLVVCADATPLSGVVSQPTPASVAGFILTQRVLDEVTILYLSIDPRYRRQGLARQLVQALQVAVGRQTICWRFVKVMSRRARYTSNAALFRWENASIIIVQRKARRGVRPRYYSTGKWVSKAANIFH